MFSAIPYYLVPLQGQHVDHGSHLTWKCEASGYPYPSYQWYKDGQLVVDVPGELSVVGNTITINNLQEKHNGMYQCAATNYLGTSMSEAQLRVLGKLLICLGSMFSINRYYLLSQILLLVCLVCHLRKPLLTN